MTASPIYRFIDGGGNAITYSFDAEIRDENGEGPVSLERDRKSVV